MIETTDSPPPTTKNAKYEDNDSSRSHHSDWCSLALFEDKFLSLLEFLARDLNFTISSITPFYHRLYRRSKDQDVENFFQLMLLAFAWAPGA